jgi:hypothetical protein
MKKIAQACGLLCAFTGAASAQSGVNLQVIVDEGVAATTATSLFPNSMIEGSSAANRDAIATRERQIGVARQEG